MPHVMIIVPEMHHMLINRDLYQNTGILGFHRTRGTISHDKGVESIELYIYYSQIETDAHSLQSKLFTVTFDPVNTLGSLLGD